MKARFGNGKIARTVGAVLTTLVLLSASGCAAIEPSLTGSVVSAQKVTSTEEVQAIEIAEVVSTATLVAPVPDTADSTTIALGESIVVTGTGVSVKGSKITITAEGAYTFRGALADGQIIVDAGDKDDVVLVLNGVDITCSTGAPIEIQNAKNAFIVLAEGSKNQITDGEAYVLEAGADEPNAAIHSKADLQISGDGALTVEANYHDAITSKDDLTITGGAIMVRSVGDGLRGRDSLAITGGRVVVDAAGDALQSNNDEDASKGLVIIEGGTLQITAGQDGIEAQSNVVVRGGEIEIAAGDDGIHAEGNVTIDGGQIDITRSYEGIEGLTIAIHAGTIHVVASDDGVNGAGGVDGSSVNGRPGQNGFGGSGNARLDISGGYLVVDAGGDGLDINGAISMTDGVVIVNGPTNDGNGALDYDGGFQMTGGLLVAIGSAGMAQAPDASSTQHAILVNLNSKAPAGTLVSISNTEGQEMLTFRPLKQYQSVVLCSPELEKGVTYIVSTGGASTGTATDGLYAGGAYTGGSEAARLTISSMVTSVGSVGRMRPSR